MNRGGCRMLGGLEKLGMVMLCDQLYHARRQAPEAQQVAAHFGMRKTQLLPLEFVQRSPICRGSLYELQIGSNVVLRQHHLPNVEQQRSSKGLLALCRIVDEFPGEASLEQ